MYYSFVQQLNYCLFPVLRPIKYSVIQPLNSNSFSLPGVIVFSDAKPASEFSEGMLWMEDRGMSVSVLVSHVDSVSLVQLSRYRGSRASVLLPPQPIAMPQGGVASHLDLSSARIKGKAETDLIYNGFCCRKLWYRLSDTFSF